PAAFAVARPGAAARGGGHPHHFRPDVRHGLPAAAQLRPRRALRRHRRAGLRLAAPPEPPRPRGLTAAAILDCGFWILDFGLERQGRIEGPRTRRFPSPNPKSKIENPKSFIPGRETVSGRRIRMG